MLSFPRGAQDKEEARWSPPPLPTTPGQGPASAQYPGECVERWQPGQQSWGVLPARPQGSCQLSLTHRQERRQKQMFPLLYSHA